MDAVYAGWMHRTALLTVVSLCLASCVRQGFGSGPDSAVVDGQLTDGVTKRPPGDGPLADRPATGDLARLDGTPSEGVASAELVPLDSSLPLDSSPPDSSPPPDSCVPKPEICNGRDDNCGGGADEGTTCPTGCTGKTYNGHAYMVCATPLAWAAAGAVCASKTFKLVRIDNNQENNALTNFSSLHLSNNSFWTGGTDQAQQGTWVWPDGGLFWSNSSPTALYNNWPLPYEPTASATERCAEVICTGAGYFKPGDWNNLDCGTQRYFICEMY